MSNSKTAQKGALGLDALAGLALPSGALAVPGQASIAVPKSSWLTPTKIKGLGIAMAISLAAAGWAGFHAFAAQSEQQDILATKTAPAIEGVAQARASLSDANSNMMEAFIGGERVKSASWYMYELDMSQAQRAIEQAAETVSSGSDQQRGALLEMMAGLSDYERLVGEALAQPGDQARPSIEKADNLMHSRVLPAADALTHAASQKMGVDYGRQETSAKRWAGISTFFAALFLALAIGGQVWLAGRTRRRLNIGLLAGSVVAAVALIGAGASFHTAQNATAVAREGAFDSINALWRARAAVYDANADESLWLFAQGDPAKQSQRLGDFAQQIQTLIGGFDGNGAAKKAHDGVAFGGFLGQLSQNAHQKDNGKDPTFAGEADAVSASVDALSTYLFAEEKMHQIASGGDFAGALDWRSGHTGGWSAWAFGYLDSRLQSVMDINRTAFDAKTAEAQAATNGYVWKLTLALLLTAALCGAGLFARLREYSF
jgi:hypothetical protein